MKRLENPLNTLRSALSDRKSNSTIQSPSNDAPIDPQYAEMLQSEVHASPKVGYIYIVTSVSDGRQLTLLDGDVVLAQHASKGSPYWRCVKYDGWLGFRNVASGRYLGHDGGSKTRCVSETLDEWERVQVRPHLTVKGAYTLGLEYWGKWLPLGIKNEHGVETLARVRAKGAVGLPLIFIEVEGSD